MIVSDESAEEAINFLAESDAEYANLKYRMEAMNTKRDLTEKEVFLHCQGPVEQRKASARTHDNTKQAHRDYLEAMRAFEKLKAERDTATTKLWVWKASKQSEKVTV